MRVNATSTYRYFAYGSNMSTARLRGRVPSARPLCRGRLLHHALRWHKLGRDGSGKCDVAYCGKSSTDVVWGVLFDIDWAEKRLLDTAEGLGIGYLEKNVTIASCDGDCAALTYQAKADMTAPSLRPHEWYKAHVLRGAREHGLPDHYVAALEAVETVEQSES